MTDLCIVCFSTQQHSFCQRHGGKQPSDKGSPSGEAMHGFEPTQAREGPLLLHKVF